MIYRAQKAMYGNHWVVQRQFPCVNGLYAWFDICMVDEASEEELGYTEGAFGTAEERANIIASSLNNKVEE